MNPFKLRRFIGSAVAVLALLLVPGMSHAAKKAKAKPTPTPKPVAKVLVKTEPTPTPSPTPVMAPAPKVEAIATAPEPRTAKSSYKLTGTLEYPVAVGTMAQNFSSNFGFSGDLYVPSLIAPWVSNYVSVSYTSFSLRSDTSSSFRLIPFVVGLGLPGKVTNEITTDFGLGIGGAIGYINAPGATSYRSYGYFMAQVRGGVEYDFGSGFSAYVRVPINFLISSNRMTYIAYAVGAAFRF
jgi:hypothetical protein